ncbi:hypothetical protein CP533_1250 [Ophiocordyceps camponoti-saundersi (nom. inval.)]|nr:hypothetical protein CP533_1250 [Ophiocordyceps camponoti-saundersi (nom. inval.)]
MAKASGTCDARFEEVRRLLEKKVESGEEVGASIAVNLDGKLVVDLWAGYMDRSRSVPWQRDTIVNVFSCTKTVVGLAFLMLVDRGLIDLDDKVSKYWPEFACNGKEDILIRHVLSHTSGLAGFDDELVVEDLYDFDRCVARLLSQAPWWKPGTASGYQVYTYGFILGELIRRVTGKTLKEFVADEISAPLEADFQIGAAEKDWDRVTDIVPPKSWPDFSTQASESLMRKAFWNPPADSYFANTAGWRNAEIGSSNGHGNARSLVRILSAVALGGEVDGKRLLSEKTIDLIGEEQSSGIDRVFRCPIRWGIGFALTPSVLQPFLPKGRVYFWQGTGGSFVAIDLDRRMTVAYTMNKVADAMGPSDRAEAYGRAIYRAL